MEFNRSQFNEGAFSEPIVGGTTYTITLSESVTSSDTESNIPEKVLADSIFLNDDLRGRLIGKGCADTIRMADWLTIKRSTSQSGWFD